MTSRVLLAIVAIVICGMSYLWFNENATKKRAAQAALDRLTQTVESMDPHNISDQLQQLLTDNATIELEIYFYTIGNNAPTKTQKFDKNQFISFIDNLVYSLDDYRYTPWVTHVNTNTSEVEFTSVEWADGVNMLRGIKVDMRYSSDTKCKGVFDFSQEPSKISSVKCSLKFQQVPKPGQAGQVSDYQKMMDRIKNP